jgi:hypothetical protein
MTTLSDLCKSCGECCKHIVLPVEMPINKSVFDGWIEARGFEIVAKSDSKVLVKIPHVCPHLQKSGDEWTCDMYNSENYPDGCRDFDGRQYPYLDCKWKKALFFHVILEKAGDKCPSCGRTGVQLRRFKEGPYWIREFKCANGHIHREVQ